MPSQNRVHPDPDLPALGIRQPWAELILRGIKTVEVRSQDTKLRGPIYLYVSKRPSQASIALEAAAQHGLEMEDLPYGLIVGTAEIAATRPCQPTDARAACVPRAWLKGKFAWHLQNARRFDQPLKARFLPYGMWFYPFRRRGRGRSRSPSPDQETKRG